MGNRQSDASAQMAQNLNVVMFGLDGSGKTQLMYSALVGNDALENLKIQEKNFTGV